MLFTPLGSTFNFTLGFSFEQGSRKVNVLQRNLREDALYKKGKKRSTGPVQSFRKFRHLNLTSSVLLLAISFLVFGYVSMGRLGLFISLLISLTFVFFMLFHEPLSLSRWLQVRPWAGQDPWQINTLIHHFARKLKMPVPQFALFPSSTPLVFSEAKNQIDGTIGISTGAIERLSGEELESLIVLAMVRLQQQQKISSALVLKLVLILSRFSVFFDTRLGLRNLKPFYRLCRPLVTIMNKIWLGHQDVFDLDKKANNELSKKSVLGESLSKIHNSLFSSPIDVPFGTEQYLLMSFTQPRHKAMRLFPTVEERIKRLVGYHPI